MRAGTSNSVTSVYIDKLMAVLDLGRLVVAHCANTPTVSGNREKFFDLLFNASDWSSVVSRGSPMSKSQETNVLLLLRIITNCFQEGIPVDDGRWVLQVKEFALLSISSSPLHQILEALSLAPYHALSKPHRVALASILSKSVFVT